MMRLYQCMMTTIFHLGAAAQVLFGLRGVVQPGEVLGLMGPSGSGKTSLISVLGGRKPQSMTITGDVSFNGTPLNRSLKSNMGFVLQDDVLFDSLTVYETLYYAARLRLPQSMPMCVSSTLALSVRVCSAM